MQSCPYYHNFSARYMCSNFLSGFITTTVLRVIHAEIFSSAVLLQLFYMCYVQQFCLSFYNNFSASICAAIVSQSSLQKYKDKTKIISLMLYS